MFKLRNTGRGRSLPNSGNQEVLEWPSRGGQRGGVRDAAEAERRPVAQKTTRGSCAPEQEMVGGLPEPPGQ